MHLTINMRMRICAHAYLSRDSVDILHDSASYKHAIIARLSS